MRTSTVCKKIVLCGICEFLVRFRSDGVVCICYVRHYADMGS